MRAPTRLSGVLVRHPFSNRASIRPTSSANGEITADFLPWAFAARVLGQIRHQEKGKPGVDPAGHLHSRSGLAAGLVLAIAAMGLEDFWDGRTRVDDHGRVPPATFATAIFSPARFMRHS